MSKLSEFLPKEVIANSPLLVGATYFSLDAIHEIVFGERAGFIEEGRDVNNVIFGVHQMMAPVLLVSFAISKINYQTIKNRAVFTLHDSRSPDPEESPLAMVQ
jgi:hypothetical protein